MTDIALQLAGHRLTTAEITYHMPDYPALLQTFVWQNLDAAPRFPELRRFLVHWEHNLDGALHQVRVASAQLIRPAELRFVDGDFLLN